MRGKILLVGAALLGTACANAKAFAQGQTQGQEGALSISAPFVNSEGQEIGEATFIDTPSGAGVLIRIELQESHHQRHPRPGVHALHLHSVGRCELPDFASAAEHYNPAGKEHGIMSPVGKHAGDLPNIDIRGVGTTQRIFEVLVPEATLRDVEGSLLDEDGSALVVHAQADDYVTTPHGNAGPGVACAALQRTGG